MEVDFTASNGPQELDIPLGGAASVIKINGDVVLVVRPNGDVDLPGDVIRPGSDAEAAAMEAAHAEVGAVMDELAWVGYIPFPWGAMGIFTGSAKRLDMVRIGRRSRGRAVLSFDRAVRRFEANSDADMFGRAYTDALRAARSARAAGDQI